MSKSKNTYRKMMERQKARQQRAKNQSETQSKRDRVKNALATAKPGQHLLLEEATPHVPDYKGYGDHPVRRWQVRWTDYSGKHVKSFEILGQADSFRNDSPTAIIVDRWTGKKVNE